MLEIDVDQAAIVREIYQGFMDGASCTMIADALNGCNVASPCNATRESRVRHNTTNTLSDELKEAHAIESDYAQTKLLGVESSALSSYRRFRSQLSDEMALRVAKLLDRPPGPILAMLAAERAKDPEVSKVWKDAAKVLMGGKDREVARRARPAFTAPASSSILWENELAGRKA